MGVQQPNSTNYRHPHESHLLDLHNAMDYNPEGRPILRVEDARAGYTSKNRLQISQYQTVFFNTFQFGKETDIWDESTANSGTATFDGNLSSVVMRVTNTQGSQVIRQTRNVMRYIPGRYNELSYSVRLQTPVAGIRRRIGMFDENNGVYFEDAGDGTYYCVIRSKTSGSVVETRIPRSDWNGDRLDGTGPSSLVANPNTQQMFVINYDWYGVGQVKFGWLIRGHIHTIHTFENSNTITTPWCSTPFLPIRLELTNTTGGQTAPYHYMWQGSNSLTTEGEAEKLGIAQNITSPITGRTMAAANTFYPILSIRLKSSNLQGIVLPTFFQAATLDNTSVFYKLVTNATLTGANFVDMPDANAFTQYDISATSYTGGTDIDSGFVISGGGGTGIRLDRDTVYQIGRSSLGTVSDTLTLAVAAPIANKAALAAMTWIEQR
jgi:hypothetical protein